MGVAWKESTAEGLRSNIRRVAELLDTSAVKRTIQRTAFGYTPRRCQSASHGKNTRCSNDVFCTDLDNIGLSSWVKSLRYPMKSSASIKYYLISNRTRDTEQQQ